MSSSPTTSPLKVFLMFAPFVLFFGGLAGLVNDMRHPSTLSDQCKISATGKDVSELHIGGPYIYKQSNNALNDVSLECNRFGTLLLNDVNLFITPLAKGQTAYVSRKRYQFIPERWMVSVRTGQAGNRKAQ
jgi:hypothetical protein